jgi:hypothetical protein
MLRAAKIVIDTVAGRCDDAPIFRIDRLAQCPVGLGSLGVDGELVVEDAHFALREGYLHSVFLDRSPD